MEIRKRPVCRWGCNGARAAGAPCQGRDGITIDTLRITLSRNLAIAESVEPTRLYLVLLAGSMHPLAAHVVDVSVLHQCEMPKQGRAAD